MCSERLAPQVFGPDKDMNWDAWYQDELINRLKRVLTHLGIHDFSQKVRSCSQLGSAHAQLTRGKLLITAIADCEECGRVCNSCPKCSRHAMINCATPDA